MDQIQVYNTVSAEGQESQSLEGPHSSQSMSPEGTVFTQAALDGPVSSASFAFRYVACWAMRCNSALLNSSTRCALSSCSLSCKCTACAHACTGCISGLTSSSTCLHASLPAWQPVHSSMSLLMPNPFSAVQHSILPSSACTSTIFTLRNTPQVRDHQAGVSMVDAQICRP